VKALHAQLRLFCGFAAAFAASLLRRYCGFTAALVRLYCCFTGDPLLRECVAFLRLSCGCYCGFTVALLLACLFSSVRLRLFCGFTAALPVKKKFPNNLRRHLLS
jgi:hypothetical protein